MQTTNAAEYEWVKVTTSAPFYGRDGAGGLVYKDAMWLIGGWNPSDKKIFPRICTNDVWRSTDGATWELIKPNTFIDQSFDPLKDWEGRHTAGYVVHKDRMWIVGGDCNQKHYQNDVWSSTDGKNWKHENPGKPVPWGPRAIQHCVAFNDRIWVMGGQTMPAFAGEKEEFYNDVWSTEDGVNWKKHETKGEMWSPRGMIGNNAVFNGRMWIIGGGTYDTPEHPARNFYNDVWSSADGESWTCHARSSSWSPRQYHEIAAFDGNLWVMEGYNVASGNRKDVWYSPDGVNWKEIPDTPWAPRHAATVYVYDNALWMVAGNNMQPDAWKLIRK